MFDRPLPLLPLVLDDVPRGLRQALAQEGMPQCPWQEGPARGRFLLYDSQHGRPRVQDPRQVPIDVDALRSGTVEDPLAALGDLAWSRVQWHVAGLALVEEVSRVNKRAVRGLVLERLRAAIEAAGGIWLRAAAYPFPYRSAFCLRIDYDDYEPAEFDALLGALAGHEEATSHYVNGEAFADAPEALVRLRSLDVGSHGFHHHTYRTVEENENNIRRGIETLEAAGIEPAGFAAPHGRYYPELGRALARLSVSHSGEFTLAYDELPFFPGDDVLQIPVHPVCLGLFLEATRAASPEATELDSRLASAADAAGDYFCDLIETRYRSGEPALVYGHPTGRLGRYPDVPRRMLAAAGRCSALWKTTHSRLAAWWKARSAVALQVSEDDGGYVVSAQGLPRGWTLGIELVRGRHVALGPMDRPTVRFSPAALAYESRQGRPTVHPVRIDGRQGLRSHLRRLIDWERVTPLEEIGATGWRNLAKRTLRRWWK